MKQVILLLIYLLIRGLVFSQNISITDSHGTILNNGIYIVTGSTQDPTVYAFVNVTNNKTTSISLWCKKIIIYSVPGSDNSFCWAGNCYPTTQIISGFAQTIAPGTTVNQSNNGFTGEYYPYLNGGTDSVKYRFFTIPAADSAEFTVVYDVPLGISPIVNKINSFTINPNPASDYLVINSDNKVSSKQTINIYNCLGSIVRKISPESFNKPVNISNLQSGLYFCTLFINDKKVSSKKLLISR